MTNNYPDGHDPHRNNLENPPEPCTHPEFVEDFIGENESKCVVCGELLANLLNQK